MSEQDNSDEFNEFDVDRAEEEQQSFGARMKEGAKQARVPIILVGVVGALAVAFLLFSGSDEPTRQSSVTDPGIGKQAAQGSGAVNPSYRQALQRGDEKRITDAKKAGGSAMPTVVTSRADEKVTLLDVKNEKPKPEEKPKVVRKPAPVAQNRPKVTGADTAPRSVRFDEQTSQNMARFVSAPAPTYAPAETTMVYQDDQRGQDSQNVVGGGDGGQVVSAVPGDTGAGQTQSSPIADKLPLSGQVVYARMINRANSDAPGPVIAEILSGPLAGARVIGSFKTARDALVIEFKKISVDTDENGKAIKLTTPIDAVAVDPKYMGTAMATSVNRREFEKIATAFVTSFVQGLGSAIANSGSTSVSLSDGSVTTQNANLNTTEQLVVAGGQAAGEVGDILKSEYANRPTTVIVEAGTEFGLLFL